MLIFLIFVLLFTKITLKKEKTMQNKFNSEFYDLIPNLVKCHKDVFNKKNKIHPFIYFAATSFFLYLSYLFFLTPSFQSFLTAFISFMITLIPFSLLNRELRIRKWMHVAKYLTTEDKNQIALNLRDFHAKDVFSMYNKQCEKRDLTNYIEQETRYYAIYLLHPNLRKNAISMQFIFDEHEWSLSYKSDYEISEAEAYKNRNENKINYDKILDDLA